MQSMRSGAGIHLRPLSCVILALAIMLLTGCVSTYSSKSRLGIDFGGASIGITIKNFLYQPVTLTVPVGATVTWTQLDEIPHTVTSGRAGAEDAGTVFDDTETKVNQAFSFTFGSPGTYAYFCRFHTEMVAGIVVTGAGGVVPTSTAAAQAAVTPPPTPPSSAKLVADKLMNPRGFTFGPDGAIYVAETGTKAEDGVTVTPPAGPVKAGCEAWRPSFDRIQAHCPGVVAPKNGTNGRITRIAPDGTRTTVADHLPVVDGPFQATMGVTSVAFIGRDLYAVLAAGETRGEPNFPTGVYKVNADGSVTLFANLEAFQKANPPAYIPPDYNYSNPYDMIAMNGKLYISDGNACVIFEVDPAKAEPQRVRRLTDMSVGHPITTGLAAGPDGNLYVTIMTIPPYPPGAAKVFKITSDGKVSETGSGFNLGTGLAIAPDGTFYVAEFADAPGKAPYVVPPGRIVRQSPNGAPQVVAAPLMYPGALRWGPDGLYSTFNTIGTVQGGPAIGAIYKIDTGGR